MNGEAVKCPECQHVGSLNSFDVLGADGGKVFCPKCGGHVEVSYAFKLLGRRRDLPKPFYGNAGGKAAGA